MKHFYIVFFVFSTILLLAQSIAHAQDPKIILSKPNSDWTAYVYEENGNKVCYMASQPIKAEGNYSKRGDIFALVTHRPAQDTRDVFSYISGYTYKTNSNVSLTVGSRKISLFTNNDMAWAVDDKTDRDITNAIRNGSRMIVQGTSSRGTKTKDTFSLKGSSAAYDAISRECGLAP